MRTTFTTAELTSRLRAPALRALEGVARQLGVRLPRSEEAHARDEGAVDSGATLSSSVGAEATPSAHGQALPTGASVAAQSGDVAVRFEARTASAGVVRPPSRPSSNEGARARAAHGPEALSSREVVHPHEASVLLASSGEAPRETQRPVPRAPGLLAPRAEREAPGTAGHAENGTRGLAPGASAVHASPASSREARDLPVGEAALLAPGASSGDALHEARSLASSSDSLRKARGLAPRTAPLLASSSDVMHEARSLAPEASALLASLASSSEATHVARGLGPEVSAPRAPSHGTDEALFRPAPHASSRDATRTSARMTLTERDAAARSTPLPASVALTAPSPAQERSSDTTMRSSADGHGMATTPLSLSVGPRPDSSPHTSAPAGPHGLLVSAGATSVGTTPAPEGLRISVKSADPASPKRQVVRLIRALPPSSTSMPEARSASAPASSTAAPEVPPPPHERASAAPLSSPAASGTSMTADVGPRPRVVQLLSPTPPSPTAATARPRTRLTFAPPEAPPTPPPTAPLTREVSHARQLSIPAPSPEPTTSSPVQNTFNVSVQVGADSPTTGLDRRTLEDTLVDLLRESARRHGLEV